MPSSNIDVQCIYNYVSMCIWFVTFKKRFECL